MTIKIINLKITTAVFLLASCFIFAMCKKEHLSEFYFKCKVDGQNYEPDNCANCLTREILGDTILSLGANKGFEALGLGVLDFPVKRKSYVLDIKNALPAGRGGAVYDNVLGSPGNDFRTDSLRTGQLVISTLDKTNKIIEGSFYFDAYNPVQNKTVKITDGKFRLQYKAY